MNVLKVNKRQQGVTLIEMAIVIAMMAIVMSSLFPTIQTLLSQIGGLRGERFEVYVSESLAAYYEDNFTDYDAPDLVGLPDPAHIPVADINVYATGGVGDLSTDFNNKNWYYTSCGIQEAITEPIDFAYCSVVGYTTVNGAQLGLAQLATLPDAASWAAQPNVEQFVIFNGHHIVKSKLLETKSMVEKARDRLEGYYKNLLYSAEDQSFTINRFASAPHTIALPEVVVLYDPNSDLGNTGAANTGRLFTAAEKTALGLTDGDLTTPFDIEIRFDNGSGDTRNPEEGDTLPYTARVWVDVIAGDPNTRIEAIAVSKF